jgi:hypothetical protein
MRNVLGFSNIKVPQGKVARAYAKWRRNQNIPDRCDNPKCQFHRGPLMWNGKPLKLILDHAEGNKTSVFTGKKRGQPSRPVSERIRST